MRDAIANKHDLFLLQHIPVAGAYLPLRSDKREPAPC